MKDDHNAPALREFLTLNAVCDLLDVERHTLKGWLDAGALPHYRFSPRSIRIKRSDLEDFITASRHSGANASEVMILRGRRSDHREVAMREGAA